MSIDIGGVTPSHNRSLSLQPSYAFDVILCCICWYQPAGMSLGRMFPVLSNIDDKSNYIIYKSCGFFHVLYSRNIFIKMFREYKT